MPRSPRFTVTAEVAAAITSSLVIDEVLANIACRTAEVLEVSECDIYGYRRGEPTATCLALWTREATPGDDEWVGGKIDLTAQPTFAHVLREGRIIAAYLDDPGLPEADRERMDAWGEEASLFVPLVFRDEVIGCLQIIEKRHRRVFGARERELAATLATLAAVAIENARLHASLEEQAITDGLTGLYNHRYFYERLSQEVARAQRYRLPLSLLMIDIDDFKAFNDRHGHRAGDDLLRDVAALLRDETRHQVDLVARYGGEEFAVVLPNTTAAGAEVAAERLQQRCGGGAGEAVAAAGQAATPAEMAEAVATHVPAGAGAPPTPAAAASGTPEAARAVAERVRRRVAESSFGHGGAWFAHAAAPAVPKTPPVVTVSIGVASLADCEPSVDALVETADRALYRAKERGKNRVALAAEPASE